jgi:hypothetical protein
MAFNTVTISLNPGFNSLVQNTVYALPPWQCSIYTDATTPTIVQSSDQAITATTAVTLSAGVFTCNGGFLKLTSSGPINCWVKRID